MVEERRKQLFNKYIDWIFKSREVQQYSEVEVKYWLIWLAQTILKDSQTVFLIERLQPLTLKTLTQKIIYIIGFELLQSLIIALCNLPFIIFVIHQEKVIIYFLFYSIFKKTFIYLFSDTKITKTIESRLKIVEKIKFDPMQIIISTFSYFLFLFKVLLYIIKFLILSFPKKLLIYFGVVCRRLFSLIPNWKQLIIILMFGPIGIGIIITYLLKGEGIIEQIISLFRIIKFHKILYISFSLFIWFSCVYLAPKFFVFHWIMIAMFYELHGKVIADLIVSVIEEETVIPN
ncbi:MAG: hypothetical protein V7K18_02045 [Nostoc sp.]|uniref:hypothetical protein n=1 Tax=Nostoc sp. TaxID=1180 RepID=UPI002FFCD6D1